MGTHLVTLDLSVPEFLRRREDYVVHHTRGGFRAWMNPLLAGDDDEPVEKRRPSNGLDDGTVAATTTALHGARNGHAVGDASDAEDENRNDNDTAANSAKIQILDLHSAQPIVSYRGTVFAGVWTETVGTEMLFVDAKSSSSTTTKTTTPLPLPHVRRLPQDVDLLGASTARIACTPIELRRRQNKTAARPTASSSNTPRRQFAIPVAGGATEQRQRQAAFLERLMAAKHGRGERDVVTVQAVETRQDTVQDDVEEERLRRKKAAQFERYRLRASRRRRGEEGLGVGVGVGLADGVEVRVRTEAATTMEAMTATDTPTEPRIRTPARNRKKPRPSVARDSGDVGRGQDDDGSESEG
ncbi:hypothetical protein CMQ_2401 [Grosmannia clavigera kw1407]|uniref:Transcription factor TFIIIC triple barrel domain-containing protein n=1 Tax=Grosmannia clavigera (strain kw1407 / UAMH 11150) TaxID=655863 RepID=F0XJQ6_GROCL|nr:uncharacterized protein CMQ_2401 [Grosmannia clavigera kw1407]EFX02352.1 hypothetical protein CMQ_2401 [Grosmannia clavigera kw1407]